MSFLARPFEHRSTEESGVENPASWLINLLGGPTTASGVRVSPESALRAAAVYASVRVLAETLGSLSLNVYRRLPDGGKERITAHPVAQLLHTAPNPEMTSPEWRETVMAAKALRGNGYSQIIFGPDGRPAALWPLHPDRVAVRRDSTTRELRYDYTDEDGRTLKLRFGAVLHERSFGGNGIMGWSPIRMAAEAIGISLAAEEHGARFFSNGANPTGVLQGDKTLTDAAYARLRSEFNARNAGGANARGTMILEDGFKWQGISLNHEQAQFLETRKFQVAEIARIFRVPAHLIGDLDRSTNNNIEHQSLEFVMYCMLPWCVRTEQRYNQTLFLPSEQAELFCEFNLDSLLRGDAKSRAEANQIRRFNGVLNANEWRAQDNLNPYEGGEKFLVQAAMIPVEDVGKNYGGAAKPADPTPSPDQKRLADILLPVVLSGAQRAIRKEAKALRTIAKRGEGVSAVAQFYAEHRTYLTEQIGPAFESLGLSIGKDITPQARSLADSFCGEQQRLAEAAVGDSAAVEALVASWEQSRASDLARRALSILPPTTEAAA